MKILIHDLKNEDLPDVIKSSQDVKIISDNGKIKRCTGCFGCWIKTPGQCILEDEYQRMGELLGKAEEVILISRCSFGSYSSFVKNVMDRSISYMLPGFTIREHEMHHKARYHNHIKLRVYFYGEEITQAEKNTAEDLVRANALNFQGIVEEILFYPDKYKCLENVKW